MKIAGVPILIIMALATVGFATDGNAQELMKRAVTIQFNNKEIVKVLTTIGQKANVKFTYLPGIFPADTRVSMNFNKEPLERVLEQLLVPYNVGYQTSGEFIILKKLNPTPKSSMLDVKSKVERIIDEITITGKITDDKGESLPGVSIILKGTQRGTVTNIDGNYSFNVPDKSAVLVFSYVGYLPQEIVVGDRSKLNIQLSPDQKSLDEVVVIGYGVAKKSDLTGSVSSIKSERLLDKPVVNVGQAMSGKISGVEVSQNGGTPDGKMRIRIRGDNSINSSNEPLYVIDGIIGVADINLLNPNDIASLEVLKDASATAIYGARGANGVILITTKRGMSSEKSIISYDGYVSFGTLARKIELLNSTEWLQLYNVTQDNAAKYDPAGYAQGKYPRMNTASLPKLFNADGTPIYNTDWQDEAYQTAKTTNHSLSIRGGNEKTVYSASLGYLHADALIRESYLNRYTLRLNFDSNLKKWLKVGGNVSLNYNKGNDHYANYGIKRLVMEAIPLIPVKYPDGTWASNRDIPGAVQDTPARYLEEMVNQTSNTQTIANFYSDFKINDELDFKVTFATDLKNRKTNYYSGKNLIQFSKNQGGIATISTENQTYWQNENYLNWNKEFNPKNRLNLMVGLSWQQRSAEMLSVTQQQFIDDFYQWHNLGGGTVSIPPSSSDWRWSLNSYFARFNYTLADKYLFTATGRYDGSSKFGQNNKYAFFPSLAFAWRISDEEFIKDNTKISNLKFRTSFGRTGNQEIANYAYAQNLGLTNIIFNDTFYSALSRSTFGNPDLKWEKTTQIDAGLDFGLLNQRIDVTLDYYHKVTSDLLLNAPIPYTSGLSSVMTNIGSVKNQGFELSVTSHNIEKGNFSWNTTVIASRNRNKILKLGANNEDIFPGPRHAQGDLAILRVGQPVGSFWGLTRLGTWGTGQADEAAKYNRLPGDLKYADLNKDGKINNDDNSIIGRGTPNWSMGISNNLKYKNFELAFDVRIVQGIDVINAATHNREDRFGVANGARSLLNSWTPTNQNTMLAERRPLKTYYDSYPDTHWLQDGSYIRGQNLLLGYTFGATTIQRLKVDRLRIYASLQNFFLITKYNGYDPEVSTAPDQAFGQGVDDFGDPRPRTFTVGLSVNF